MQSKGTEHTCGGGGGRDGGVSDSGKDDNLINTQDMKYR